MRTKSTHLTAIFGATAATVALLGAPVAAADPGQSCYASRVNGPGTACESPGNAQINDAPPSVEFLPYGGLGPALGIAAGR